jgi:uncharacterized protein YcbK (DUF882 family)
MQLTENFWLSEFACNDRTEVPEHLIPNVQFLAEQLQVIRDVIGEPIHINSAYRHEEYNSAIGGSIRSQHILAKAADLRVGEGFSSGILYDVIIELIKDGSIYDGGVGLYSSFVHYDVRTSGRARW